MYCLTTASGEPEVSVARRIQHVGNRSRVGLSWRVTIPNGAGLFNGRLPGGGIGEQDIVGQFVAPPDAELVRLVLGYERVKGTVRIKGSAEIRRVELFHVE